MYQIDEGCRRLLWIGEGRTKNTHQTFFDSFCVRKNDLTAICSDMWKPYIYIIRKNAKNAILVLDRFLIAMHMKTAIDKIRAEETRRLAADGYEPYLKKTRYLLLERPENLPSKQDVQLSRLLQYNLKSVRAYLLKEDFQQFWNY